MRTPPVLLLGLLVGPGLACKSGTEPRPPSAAQLGIAVAPSANARSGVALSVQPIIALEDGQAQPFAQAGRTVTAVLATPGGTLTGTLSVKTDGAGRAVFADLVIRGPVGPWTLRFDCPGLRSVSTDPIQLGAGAPVLLAAVTGSLQTSVAGTPVAIAPSVRVSDAEGNAIAGAAVEFAASAGGSVDGGSTVTNATGIAAPLRWTLSADLGLNTLTATTSVIPGASVSFTATGTAGPPAILTLVTGDGQSATVGGSVAIAPAVKLTDAAGHVLAGVMINFAPGPGGGAVTNGSPLTGVDGIAAVGSWSLGLPPGDNTLVASRAGVPPFTFHATGIAFLVQTLSAGESHSCALDPGGNAFCWGSNGNNRLGTGTAETRDSVPRAVSGGLSFVSIGAGVDHTCGLLANGDAYCWGGNDVGQLGDGTTVRRSTPTPVTGGLKFSALGLGGGVTCGLVVNGTVQCWGFGQQGQLGDGGTANRLVPGLVAGSHVFVELTVGRNHSCGRKADGSLFCWGVNDNGELGDGSTTDRPVPTAVSGGLGFATVSAGSMHTCAVAAGGAGYCWGRGTSGRLGTGTATSQSSPVAISGGPSLLSVSANAGQSCALTTAGQAYCWGLNASGELGDGTTVNRLVPTAVLGGLTFSAVAAGSERTCARATAGGAYCWGRNDAGAVGDGTLVARQKPVGVVKP